jgi:hypothetical protein
MAVPRVLVIAGSDCSGGAGLEADQKVLAAHGCYAMTATTALTAQNTLGVQDVHVTPPSFVAKQINSCLDDIKAEVVKIGRRLHLRLRHILSDVGSGMLASAETVSVVAETLQAQRVSSIVLDPVGPPLVIPLSLRKVLGRLHAQFPHIGYGCYKWCAAVTWRCCPPTSGEASAHDYHIDTEQSRSYSPLARRQCPLQSPGRLGMRQVAGKESSQFGPEGGPAEGRTHAFDESIQSSQRP